jgi:GTP-binding protein EngB required for normal cell division
MQTRRDPRTDAPPELKPLKKGRITIIIVGETGVGKTAFMNLLANVCEGRPVHKFRQVHNSRNESNLDKNQSQTNAAMMYTFKRRDGVELRMLDTPGLCDTRGLEQDKRHKKSIAEAIRSQVQILDAVIIIANGTIERVGPGVEYALHTLGAMFPRSIADNIGFMFTNVPDVLSFNFQQQMLPAEIRHPGIWTIQNPMAQLSKYQAVKTGGHRSERQLQSMEKLLENNYVVTMETLNDFFSWLDQRKVQPTNTIVDLYDVTTSIEAAIANVITQIDQRERQRMDLKKLQHDLDRNKQVGSIFFVTYPIDSNLMYRKPLGHGY